MMNAGRGWRAGLTNCGNWGRFEMGMTRDGLQIGFDAPAVRINGGAKHLEPAGQAWPEALSDAAFHGIAGEYVRLVEPASETDPAALLLQFLTAAGNVIGHRPHYMVEDTAHHMNIYLRADRAHGEKPQGNKLEPRKADVF